MKLYWRNRPLGGTEKKRGKNVISLFRRSDRLTRKKTEWTIDRPVPKLPSLDLYSTLTCGHENVTTEVSDRSREELRRALTWQSPAFDARYSSANDDKMRWLRVSFQWRFEMLGRVLISCIVISYGDRFGSEVAVEINFKRVWWLQISKQFGII